ncbi:MAG: hypothetical protein LBE49_06275 [Deltaproteobacteria bacterium]|jgi:hypothetical protein|nr:hypothetical protein [Deltaproteobacteria bacterium]
MADRTIGQIRQGDPSYDEHVIVGQIRSITPGWDAPGHYAAKFVVDCPHQARKTGKRHLTSYECSIYDYQAKLFEKLEFQKGDTILVRLEGLRLEAYLDAKGKPRAALRALVGKFLDLRPRLGDGPGGPAEWRADYPWAGASPLNEAQPVEPPDSIVNSAGQAGLPQAERSEFPGKVLRFEAPESPEGQESLGEPATLWELVSPESPESPEKPARGEKLESPEEPQSSEKLEKASAPLGPIEFDPPLTIKIPPYVPGGPRVSFKSFDELKQIFYDNRDISEFVPSSIYPDFTEAHCATLKAQKTFESFDRALAGQELGIKVKRRMIKASKKPAQPVSEANGANEDKPDSPITKRRQARREPPVSGAAGEGPDAPEAPSLKPSGPRM